MFLLLIVFGVCALAQKGGAGENKAQRDDMAIAPAADGAAGTGVDLHMPRHQFVAQSQLPIRAFTRDAKTLQRGTRGRLHFGIERRAPSCAAAMLPALTVVQRA